MPTEVHYLCWTGDRFRECGTVFITRPVHDQLLGLLPSLIEEIFEENPEPVWQLAGVSVTMSPELYDSYVYHLGRLLPHVLYDEECLR